ncbi:MAG: 2-oxoacid:acceptor oxidoreductase family protein [Candidatus Bathyarchaeales archaeon]
MTKHMEIRICGLGGQGVVLAGQVLGKAAVFDGLNVVQTQSYGAEARGSAAKSEIILSDTKIGFPMIRRCDVLVAMSQKSLDMYVKDLKNDGILIVDEGLVEKIPSGLKAKTFRVVATKTAENEFKSKLYANMVMLGAMAKISGAVSIGALEKAIAESFPEKMKALNIKAFRKGLTLA